MGDRALTEFMTSFRSRLRVLFRSLAPAVLAVVLAVFVAVLGIACAKPIPPDLSSDVSGLSSNDTTYPNTISTDPQLLTLVSDPNSSYQENDPLCKSVNTNPQINNAGQVLYESADADKDNSNGSKQLRLWDPDGNTTLVSDPEKANGNNVFIGTGKINNAGQVVFISYYKNKSADFSVVTDMQVYFWSPATGIVLVSSPDGIVDGDRSSFEARISDSGQIVFESSSSNLPGFTRSSVSQVYLWSLEDGTKLVSSPDGIHGGDGIDHPQNFVIGSYRPQLNGSGQVVFKSDATNFLATNNARNVYLWDSERGMVLLTDGTAGTHTYEYDPAPELQSANPQINDSGQVVFEATSRENRDSTRWNVYQVYLWDPEDGPTLISSIDGKPGIDGDSDSAQINESGQVVFVSNATNLPGANGRRQVYFWSSESGLTLISGVDGQSGIDGDSYSPQINDSGQVVFGSSAINLPGANGHRQVYFWDPESDLTIVSSFDGKFGASGYSGSPQINNSGQVVFQSDASNLPGSNGSYQIYLWTPADSPSEQATKAG